MGMIIATIPIFAMIGAVDLFFNALFFVPKKVIELVFGVDFSGDAE